MAGGRGEPWTTQDRYDMGLTLAAFVLAVVSVASALSGGDSWRVRSTIWELSDSSARRTALARGFRQHDMPIDLCRAAIAMTTSSLDIPPRRVITVADTPNLFVTRVCMTDGSSALVTCTASEKTMAVEQFPADAGCL